MNEVAANFVCGFGDLQAGLGGLAWDIGEPGALMLSEGKVRPATFALEVDGDATTREIPAAADTVETTLSAQRTLIEHPDAENSVEFTATAAVGEVRSKGAGKTFECPGQI